MSLDAASKARTVAIGAFDGVHVAHRELLAGAEPPVTVLTWEPEPTDELLCPVRRRVELLAELGVTPVVAAARDEAVPNAGGGAVVVTDPDEQDPAVQEAVRGALDAGDVVGAARLLARPPEVEGTIVVGDARGRTLGYPTANVEVAPSLVLPGLGIYAGWAAGTRAAVSIGTNPTYGGRERRIEAFLLDFDGDLYGQRLVIELWAKLRDEQAFVSEVELVEQIARDVEHTRAAVRPT